MQARSTPRACVIQMTAIVRRLRRPRAFIFAGVAWVMLLWLPPSLLSAPPLTVRQFDLPAGPAELTLNRFSRQSGLQVLFATKVAAGVTTPAVHGRYVPLEAAHRLLAGSGLMAEWDDANGVLTVKRQPQPAVNTPIMTKVRHVLLSVLMFFSAGSQLPAQTAAPASAPADATSNAVPSSDGQHKPSPEVVNLNPFVVTNQTDAGYNFSESALGSRTVKPIGDIPSSIAVINKQLLDDLDATTIATAVNFGVSGVTNNTTNSDDVNIRGFRTNQALRDGVMIVSFKRNPLYDVDRVEIVKGPAGMLLGNTLFIGGVVNFVTKLPTDRRQSDAKIGVGTDGYFRVEANTSGPLLQSKDTTALYRVTIGGEWGSPPKMNQSVDQKFVGAAMTFKFLEGRVRLDTSFYHFVDNGYSYFDDFLDIQRSVVGGKAYLNPYSTAKFAPALDSQNFWNNTQEFFNATLTARLSENGNIRLYYAHQQSTDRRNLLRAISVQSDNHTLNRQDLPFAIDCSSNTIQAEYVYKTLRTSWRNDFQAGVDAYFEDFWQRYALYTPPPIDAANPNYAYTLPAFTGYNASNGESDKRNGSYWFQDNVTLFNDHLILIGGLRWSDGLTNNLNHNSGAVSQADSPMVQTHRYGLVYKPFKGLSLYYCDAEDLTPVGGLDGYGRPFKDQAGKMKEAGAKYNVSNEHMELSASLARYDMSQTNVNVYFTDPQLGIIIIQSPPGNTSQGWEAELRGRFHLTSGGYTDVIATYADQNTRQASDGKPAPDAPNTVVSLFIKHAWTSGPLAGFAAGAGVYDQSDENVGGGYHSDFPASYSVFARYQVNQHWTVQFNGDNVTNQRYVAYVANAALAQASLPAQYRLSVRYGW